MTFQRLEWLMVNVAVSGRSWVAAGVPAPGVSLKGSPAGGDVSRS